MSPRTFIRTRAFDTIDELLNYSERLGGSVPEIHKGPDGTIRGSVEIGKDEKPLVNPETAPK